MNTGGAERAAATSFAARDTEARLLSPLRARRFDLLLHLIANLEQPLAVCGPEGSGKTTFLHFVGEQALENWRVVALDTSVRLTAQQAQDAILAALDAGAPDDARRELDEALGELARSGRLAVVVLDDAGRLPPLTLAELHRLARRFPALRLVLALRPDEARARASTNAGLFDDCHFIEVPPLDEAHCGAFLQQLAHTPPRLLGPGDITADFVARVFLETGGVPGRILGFLAAPAGKKRAVPFRGEFVWLGVLGLSFAAALLMTVWVWREGEPDEPVPAPPVDIQAGTAPGGEPQDAATAEQQPVVGEVALPPVPEAAPAGLALAAPEAVGPAAPPPGSPEPLPETQSTVPSAEPVPPPSGVATIPSTTPGGEARSETQPLPAAPAQPAAGGPGTEPGVPSPPAPQPVPMDKAAAEPAVTAEASVASAADAASSKAREEKKESPPPPPAAESPAKRPKSAGQGKPEVKIGLPAGVSGPEWLVAQDGAAWSLQIMSARDPASIAALQKRFPGLKGLAAYRVTRKGKALYPVFYGLFPNEEEARHAAAQLPDSLGKPVPRRFGDIQRDVGAAMKAK